MENQETVKFNVETERADPKKIILSVYQALSEKGYNPITVSYTHLRAHET